MLLTLCLAYLYQVNLYSAPMHFRTSTRANACFSPAGSSKEWSNFYNSRVSPAEKSLLAEKLSKAEAQSLKESLDCVFHLKLSPQEKEILLRDFDAHYRMVDELYKYYENHFLSDDKNLRLSAGEEKTVRSFLMAKKELLERRRSAERISIENKPLPLDTFENLYLAILIHHWEFFQSVPEFLKEQLKEE
ncbi:hypothetical protein CH373_01815 [Leptospira perolatii]|uniref:Uncharacterized protein n=1 Tax=Leptospira perolatii TaxID=2023191 RepID=A0A2M9ZT95_9LEPT|nr:hypothetical protein CH360_01815 [Leptospira perolatii]PJZ75201.1 hypothetical protein CH373_01815 [Leptospira perolatii]